MSNEQSYDDDEETSDAKSTKSLFELVPKLLGVGVAMDIIRNIIEDYIEDDEMLG